eukprot:TRINITY_DN523_c1_g2_i1.p2 TRINITY_DN523_c1_g2~~TRINITY_DN523_c1_g2_i1.p2  ORF type:complete len:201 (+),score=27.72 TRINITY_DN523_c1_g2_i1:84-605(+)
MNSNNSKCPGTVSQVRCVLDTAYDKLHQGEAHQSLELVLEALKLLGNNDTAINQILYKAKTNSMKEKYAKSMADNLAHQIAQLKLEHQNDNSHEVRGSSTGGGHGSHAGETHKVSAKQEELNGDHQQPILCETEREMMVDLSLQHGKSYTCEKCGGVVGVDRKQTHEQFWCQN